jgi:hypothetical protein
VSIYFVSLKFHHIINIFFSSEKNILRSVIVLFLLTIVLPALALGDLKALLALFLKQKRVRKFTWLEKHPKS